MHSRMDLNRKIVSKSKKKVCQSSLNIEEFNNIPLICNTNENVSICKKQQIVKIFKQQTNTAKIYTTKSFSNKLKIFNSNDAAKDISQLCLQAPHPKMLFDIEHEIMNKLGSEKFMKNFPQMLKSLLDEIKHDYYSEVLHNLITNLKVPHEEKKSIEIQGFKFLGKTREYNKFLEARIHLSQQLLLTTPLIRKILDHGQILNDRIIDIKMFRSSKGIELLELYLNINKAVMKIVQYIDKDWLIEIVCYMKSKNKSIKNTIVKQKYIFVSQGVIELYISLMLRRMIETTVNIMCDQLKTPILKIKLIYKIRLTLVPNVAEIERIYMSIIKDLKFATGLIHSLYNFCTPPFSPHYIKLDVPESFLEKEYDKLKRHVNEMYKPVFEYIDHLQNKYEAIYDERSRDSQVQNQMMTFEEGCDLIEFYNKFLVLISDELKIIRFDMCIVDISEALNHLRNNTKKMINLLTKKIINLHHAENVDICESFYFLRLRAETTPDSTDQLMELTSYMTWAASGYTDLLIERVTESMKKHIRLLEIATVSQEHIDCMTETVMWIHNINQITDTNSSMLEKMKFEYEENLQRKVEQLQAKLQEMFPYLEILNDMDDADRAREYLIELRKLIKQINTFDDSVRWINNEEKLFKFPLSSYTELQEIKDLVHPFYKLCDMCFKWKRYSEMWLYGPFEKLDIDEIEVIVDRYHTELQKILKSYRSLIKAQIAENNPRRFKGLVDDIDMLNLPAPLKLCMKTLDYIKNFRPYLNLIKIFCSPALCQRHWDEMSQIAGYDMTPDAGTTLNKLMKQDFGSNLEKFEIISSGAVKERKLLDSLEKMMEEWEDISFTLGRYKNTNILIQLDDIESILEDHIMKTITMRGSVFVKHIEDEVKKWHDKIMRLSKTIGEWEKVQNQWLYFLPIFSSKDIAAQMSEENLLFSGVDSTYRNYIRGVEKDPKVMNFVGAPGAYEAMKHCTDLLDNVHEGVNSYLEKKRGVFTRFYFLSNDEMLEILSETSDPLRVQSHLHKCFEGINKLDIDKNKIIHAMYSPESEKIMFVSTIDTKAARGNVELWLVQVESQMMASVKNEIKNSFVDYNCSERIIWMRNWPGQVVLTVSQIYWTANVHKCLEDSSRNSLNLFYLDFNNKLKDTVQLVRSDIPNLHRISLKALIVIDVHAKDVIDELISSRVGTADDFKWLVQLKYYWENDCLIRMINAKIMYAYEYLGNTDRLVITPLTDRCFRTLINAYQLHLNGSAEGPAGTGKTETVKDLAKVIAIQCVVFNCSDNLDYKTMGKFFRGLASSGAWACLDEFNRIELEVLSVVAQQILSIVLAIRANQTAFVFEGTELILNPNVYICVTMNPSYAGRSQLPDNLKILFRTVAMMVPDCEIIGEVMLYSYGFINAKILSTKIITAYKLCSQQLSSQNHYDFGIRVVKTVLTACGSLKYKFPKENEDILLFRCLVDVNLPKFLNYDIPLFEGIISDLFPGLSLPDTDYTILRNACVTSCLERNLQPQESFLLKIIQTYEMMILRHGFMLVGDPFSGKTSILKVLADALTLMHNNDCEQVPVHYEFINPKSVNIDHLYGQLDPISHKWIDGVIVTYFRTFSKDECLDRNWIIFDGPIDVVWIENMNSVLDDNKKLCLASGEIISMTKSMSIIFEVMDLNQASPSTVSRCGMVYLETLTLGWRSIVESWIKSANPTWSENKENHLFTLFDWLIPPCLYFVKKNCQQLVYPGENNLIKTTLDIVQMQLNDACAEFEGTLDTGAWIQASVMYAILWGVAGILDLDSRIKFDVFYKDLWKGNNKMFPVPEENFKIEIMIPVEGMLIDYMYSFKTLKGTWKYWPDLVKQQKIEENINNKNQILIPTVDTAKYMHILTMHIEHNIPMLLVGPTGTGKSYCVQDILMNKLNGNKYEPSLITFTSSTSVSQIQDLVLSKLIKGKRGQYCASAEKMSVMFIDDLNMPAKDTYGAQSPIELLRQFLDHGHWYNLKDTRKIFPLNILFIAAMGLVGGSRQEINPRFLRHFSIFSVNDFTQDSIIKIFSNVLFISLKQNGFANDIMATVMLIVHATYKMYINSKTVLLPTPTKSHYIFNLRDFARIIQGCGMLKKESVGDNKKIFVKLWIHEILRVFYDRLVEDTDREWVYNQLKEVVRNEFKDNFDAALDILADKEGFVSEAALKYLLFGTYLDQDSAVDEKKYEEINDMKHLYDVASAAMEKYNSVEKHKLDLVLFQYALEHLSKLCRVMSMSSGNALLVGLRGSGRQSLTKLAATICNINVFQPEITNNYGFEEFRTDIKVVMKETGGFGKHTVFLFTEDELKEETFLQDIDCLLNSGEVPNIYNIDEKQEILELVRLAAQGGNRNIELSILSVYSFFIRRCKEKIHIVLTFSPVGSALRRRLRLYPSLVNYCTIDWYESWPENSLEMVARHWMQDLNIDEIIKQRVISTCKYFHIQAKEVATQFYEQFGRTIYITSASYLELIIDFQKLIDIKQDELKVGKNRYISGLDKLEFTATQVTEMQKSLEDLQPKLKEMKEKAVEMLIEIEKETKEAEKASILVREDEKIANVQAAAAQALKSECEADLALAIPVLEEAIEALNTLKPSDITLVKSMKNPPAAVKLVMAAVCVIKDVKPDRIPDPATGRMQLDFWGPSKKLLGEMTFLQQLKDFDKDHIPTSTIARIRKEFIPHKDFKPSIVAKASSAAEGLCKWIIAMDLYDAVAKEVAPKKEKLAKAEAEYAATMAVLQEKRDLVTRLEERLLKLNEQLLEAQREQMRLQKAVDLCSEKLARAKKLIGGLGGEKTRWTSVAEQLQSLYDCLAGDILISCGVIAYLAPLTLQFREKYINNWREYVISQNIPTSETYDFCKILGSEIQIKEWYINGLPRDVFSTQNSIIHNTSNRCSLFIDPQIQANKWIKSMEKKNNFSVAKFSDSDYMNKIEHCIEFGIPILIENIGESLDPSLDPILNKKFFRQEGELLISLGGTVLPYNDNFRLYMTTKMRNPHFMPEIFNKIIIINFSLTFEGLKDQLLGIVIANERPDLQKQNEQLIIDDAENRSTLKNIESKILTTLSETEGNILENEAAIAILDSAKSLSSEIVRKQNNTKARQAKIEKFTLSYTPVASYSTVLYYSISDLPNIDPMYQYSLVWFIGLYRASILNSSKLNNLSKRLSSIKNNFTINLYTNVCRSLFNEDKLIFSFLLCVKIMIFQKQITEKQFHFFLVGDTNIKEEIENPAPTWLSSTSWNNICRMNEQPSFKNIVDDFIKNIHEWKIFCESNNPEILPIPGNFKKLTNFETLMIIRFIRPDKLSKGIKLFITKTLGLEFVTPPSFDLRKFYKDSNNLSPLIFILSPGADPIMALNKFAELNGLAKTFNSLSLGQEQGPLAEVMIKEAMSSGSWVCLQNCHLAESWMPRLEKLYEQMDDSNTHDNFRLWLTSYSCDKFPIVILQNGVKMTSETPTGLQQNLKSCFTSDIIKELEYESCISEKKYQFWRLLYGLCFFHAVIQERRTFGSLGWNVPYEFNDSDLYISLKQLIVCITDFKTIPYETLSYLIGECNYGGRVTDDWDKRLLKTILADFINPDVISNRTYSFVKSTSIDHYRQPLKRNYKDYLNHIQELPDEDSPEIFGFHQNAGINRSLQMTDVIINALLLTECKTVAPFEDTNDIVITISSELLEKLPNNFDIEAANIKYPLDYFESMNTVLVQELQRFNKLLTQIRSTLIQLQKSLNGSVVMTPDMELLENSIILGRIPDSWVTYSYPSMKSLGKYFLDFLTRIEFLQNWLDNGKPPTFWISGFFSTQAFLTGAKQNYARQINIPIVELVFDHSIMNSNWMDKPPSEGVFVNGLFIIGAVWNRETCSLEEQKPRILSDEMPVIWIKPVLKYCFKENGRYKAPVYRTSKRHEVLSTMSHLANYVLPIYLETKVDVTHWIKRSVALLCQLD